MTFEFWLQGIPQIPILPFQLPILLFFALLLAIASIQSLPDARNLGRLRGAFGWFLQFSPQAWQVSPSCASRWLVCLPCRVFP